jgi:iron complex outermembrane recepter protein
MGRNVMKVRLLVGVCFAPCLLMPAQASAQSQGPDAAAAAPEGEIIVTAQKRSESLAKVAASISVLTSSDLSSRGVVSALNIQDQVANVAIGRSYDGAVDLTIRGISSSDNTNKGDPAAALNIDGIYVGRPQAAGAAFYDLERIEVLRGPQGTLYGRNANAGAINVISHRPTNALEFGGNIGYGNYKAIDANAYVNVPLDESVAVRAVLSYQKHDGYSHTANAANGFTKNLDDLDNLSGRLLFKAQLSSKATLLAGIDFSQIRGVGTTIFPSANGIAIPYARTKTSFVAGSRRDNTVNGFAQFDYDFGFADLTYLYGHRYLKLDDVLDLGGGINGVAPPIWAPNKATVNQDSHEVRLTSNGSTFKWVIGGYLFHEKGTDSLFDIQVGNFGRIIEYLQSPTISKSKAIFGQATYSILPTTRVTVGIRSTWDDKSRVGVTILGPISGAPAFLLGIPRPTENAAASYSKVTWKAGIEQDLGNGGLAYATVSTGYKAGGFNDGCLVGTNPVCSAPASTLYYQPESITAYEAGIKGKAFDGAAYFSLTGFYYNYDNLQKSTAANNSIVTVNAAKASVKGLEGDARIRVGSGGHLNMSAGLLLAHYGRYLAPNGQNLAGVDLDKAPRFNAAISYSQDFSVGPDMKVTAFAGTKYTSSYTLSDPGTLTIAPAFFKQGGTTKTELALSIGANNDRWNIQVYGRNLEDKSTIGGLIQNGGSYYFGFNEPRTFGVRASTKF